MNKYILVMAAALALATGTAEAGTQINGIPANGLVAETAELPMGGVAGSSQTVIYHSREKPAGTTVGAREGARASRR